MQNKRFEKATTNSVLNLIVFVVCCLLFLAVARSHFYPTDSSDDEASASAQAYSMSRGIQPRPWPSQERMVVQHLTLLESGECAVFAESLWAGVHQLTSTLTSQLRPLYMAIQLAISPRFEMER